MLNMATRQTFMAGWSKLEGARWSASHLKNITQPTYFLSVPKEGTKEGTWVESYWVAWWGPLISLNGWDPNQERNKPENYFSLTEQASPCIYEQQLQSPSSSCFSGKHHHTTSSKSGSKCAPTFVLGCQLYDSYYIICKLTTSKGHAFKV